MGPLTGGAATRAPAFPPRAPRGPGAGVGRAHDALAGHLPVPRILYHSTRSILQEDAGDVTLTALLARDGEAAIGKYRAAVDLLGALRGARAAEAINPAFDDEKFGAELEMTTQFFVTRLAGVTDERAILALREAFARLARTLTHHPYVLCHRDYHGQNIHILNDNLIVIDYQDLRMGPDTYDLASLARDRGVWKTLGADEEARLLSRWATVLGADRGAVGRRYLESLLQRSIKAVGTFARMAVVYRRGHYLEYVGPTLETARDCVEKLGEWPEILEHFPWQFNSE